MRVASMPMSRTPTPMSTAVSRDRPLCIAVTVLLTVLWKESDAVFMSRQNLTTDAEIAARGLVQNATSFGGAYSRRARIQSGELVAVETQTVEQEVLVRARRRTGLQMQAARRHLWLAMDRAVVG
jgi:hypothetical protein